MAQNQHNTRPRYETAAYLLGVGPMPPPRPQDIAVAVTNHLLDNPPAPNQPYQPYQPFADENIDPQLRAAQPLQPPARNGVCSVFALSRFLS